MGRTNFRDGIRRYMRAHAYGNAADADFWREIQTASGKPVLEVEKDFTRQVGLPMLRVEMKPGDAGRSLSLRQERFVMDSSTAPAAKTFWHIPVMVNTGGAAAPHLLSTEETLLGVLGGGPAIINAGQSGYVRVLYPQEMIEALSAHCRHETGGSTGSVV